MNNLSALRILAVDPGFDRCGVAILDKDTKGDLHVVFSTCIQTNKKDSFAQRLLAVQKELIRIIEQYSPSTSSIEKLFFAKNTQTALHVAEAVGVIRTTLTMYNLEPHEYTPMQIKVATTGYGNADKQAVYMMTNKLLVLDQAKRLDDEIDALAVGITHAFSYRG